MANVSQIRNLGTQIIALPIKILCFLEIARGGQYISQIHGSQRIINFILDTKH